MFYARPEAGMEIGHASMHPSAIENNVVRCRRVRLGLKRQRLGCGL